VSPRTEAVRSLLSKSDTCRAIFIARAFLLTFLLCFATAALADVAVPPLTGRVVDLTGTLAADQIAAQSQRLKDLDTRKGAQVAVLIVPTTQPETIEQYSIRAADAWKIGRRKIDDGALLVVAKNDHKLRIEVGYGLEGALTDVTARRIIDEVIVPRFKNGDFAGGIDAGLARIIGVIDGEPLPAPAPEASHGVDDVDWNNVASLAPFLLFFAVMSGGLLRASLGRLLGSAAAGGVIGLIAGIGAGSIAVGLVMAGLAFVLVLVGFASVGTGRGGYGSGWSGGGWSSGGSSSSGSSDSGGFSGGGGSFGGGGASGSW
jgi:uncharacterized protein